MAATAPAVMVGRWKALKLSLPPMKEIHEVQQLTTNVAKWLREVEAKRVAATRFGGRLPMLMEGFVDCQVELYGQPPGQITQFYASFQVSSRFNAHPSTRTRLFRTKKMEPGLLRCKTPCAIWTFQSQESKEPAVPTGVMMHIVVYQAIPITRQEPGTQIAHLSSTVFGVFAEGSMRLDDFRGGKVCSLVSVRDFTRYVGEVTLDVSSSKLPATSDALGDLMPARTGALHTMLWAPASSRRNDARFEAYITLVDKAVSSYDSNEECRFPTGEVFSWARMMPNSVWTVFGFLPIAVVLRNRGKTEIVVEEVDQMATTWILMALIKDGTSTTEYLTAASKMHEDAQSALLVLEILAGTIVAVPTMLECIEDLGGKDYWSRPLAEADLSRASTDCEERSMLVSYIIRCIRATSESNVLARPLKRLLRNYVNVHMAMLARIGPPIDEKSSHSQSQLHMSHALIPRRSYRRLISNCMPGHPESADAKEPSTEDHPTPVVVCPFLLCEGADRVQASPLFDHRIKRCRRGFGKGELLVTDGTNYDCVLGTTVTWEAETTRTPFMGDVVAIYNVDDDMHRLANGIDMDTAPLQYIPLSSSQKRPGQWRLGIDIHALMRNEVDKQTNLLGILPIGPRTNDEQSLFKSVRMLSDLIASEWDHETCVRKRNCGPTAADRKPRVTSKSKDLRGVRSGRNCLTHEEADELIRLATGSIRVVFVPNDDLKLRKKLEWAVLDVRERAKRVGPKGAELSRLTVSILSTRFYEINDGMNPCAIVAYYIASPANESKQSSVSVSGSVVSDMPLDRADGQWPKKGLLPIGQFNHDHKVPIGKNNNNNSVFEYPFMGTRRVPFNRPNHGAVAAVDAAPPLVQGGPPAEPTPTRAEVPAWISRLSRPSLSRHRDGAEGLKTTKK